MKKPDIKFLIKTALYILETERENYMQYCTENELDPEDYEENNHVYGYAVIGLLGENLK